MRGLEPKESAIELQILHYLVIVRKLFAWKNPTAGYFSPTLKRFRKHTNPYALNGAPDILCIREGRFIGFEVKTKKGKMSESQEIFRKNILNAKGFYYVVRSLEEVHRALDDFERALLAEKGELRE